MTVNWRGQGLELPAAIEQIVSIAEEGAWDEAGFIPIDGRVLWVFNEEEGTVDLFFHRQAAA